jgi:hypothetical protein
MPSRVSSVPGQGGSGRDGEGVHVTPAARSVARRVPMTITPPPDPQGSPADDTLLRSSGPWTVSERPHPSWVPHRGMRVRHRPAHEWKALKERRLPRWFIRRR